MGSSNCKSFIEKMLTRLKVQQLRQEIVKMEKYWNRYILDYRYLQTIITGWNPQETHVSVYDNYIIRRDFLKRNLQSIQDDFKKARDQLLEFWFLTEKEERHLKNHRILLTFLH
jgi:hypothetical protein